jgi:hypothetical protein
LQTLRILLEESIFFECDPVLEIAQDTWLPWLLLAQFVINAVKIYILLELWDQGYNYIVLLLLGLSLPKSNPAVVLNSIFKDDFDR